MALTPTASFPQQPKSAGAACTAAKTTYSDTTNAVLLYTAGVNGAHLVSLRATPRATVTATQLQLFVDVGGAGTNIVMVETQLMAAYTMAQTTQAPSIPFSMSLYSPLILGPSDKVYVGIGVALAGGIEFFGNFMDY